MKIHERSLLVQKASSLFGMFWLDSLVQHGISRYEDGYLVWNRIDLFWIQSAQQGLTPETACDAWGDIDLSNFAHANFAQVVGNELARLARQFDLTYGEINVVLLETRLSDVKYHLRGERHPDDPEKPSGLA